ncbi:MAG: OmpP1/FadL family transporter [bacterium]
MKKYKLCVGLMLASLLFLPVKAFSNGYTSPWLGGPLQGPAVASGAGVYWNPASIGDIKDDSLFFSIEPVYEYVSYQRAGLNPYNNDMPYNKASFHAWSALPTLGLTFELPENFSFGLGLYVPFAREAYYPKNGAERFNGSQETMFFANVTPILTYKIIPSLIIGAGFNYSTMYLDEYQSTTLDFANPSDENPLYEANIHIKGNTGPGYGWTAGIYYKPTPNFSAGIAYIASTEYTIKGNTDISTNPQLGLGNITAKSKLDFTMPQIINFGLHFLPTNDWIVDLTEQWINWSQYKNIHVQLYDASTPIANREMYVLTGFEDVLNSKVWVGYKGFRKWLIAGGAAYDPSGIPVNHIYSLNLEFNKMDVFAQVNYQVSPSTTIGVGFDHSIVEDQNVTDSIVQPPANGVYKANIEKITLLVNYNF